MSALFAIDTQALDTAALQASMRCRSAGGFVSFEGWVRDHHEGRAVTQLVYEAMPGLAEKEGTRVVEEALARFPVLKALCVHRVGELAIGEVAVWVGVSARHRDEAFRACRFIIDEIKRRVPVWKKEYFADGTAEWVNCAGCADADEGADAGKIGHGHG